MVIRILLSFCFILASLAHSSSYRDAFRIRERCSWKYHATTKCPRSTFPCSNRACIDRRLFCNGRNDCGDNSDEKFCNSASTCPPIAEMRNCMPYRCIPEKWFCDGIPDCRYGKDEEYCEGRLDNEDKLKEKALQWIAKQRNSQSTTERWGSLVDKLAVTFFLANDTWISKDDEIRTEMAYEVGIQILKRLSKRKLRKIPSSDLASYINSLIVTCWNPKRFQGLDLVQELRSRVDSQNYTNPYLLLSLCNAGETITDLDKMKLIEAFRAKYRALWTDIQAVALMALTCAKKQPGNSIDWKILNELSRELVRLQSENGTVEHMQTTALVTQALLATDSYTLFDDNKAVQQILAMQKPDGSFGSFSDTYYVLPALNCKSLVDINSKHCDHSLIDEASALDDLITSRGPKIRVRYSLWIGDEKHLKRSLALLVPTNTSFYRVMELAANIDSRFRFEYLAKDGKPYVNALWGVKDNPEEEKFWFLYSADEGFLSPAQESPEDVIPKENEHFVMWYRSGSWVV